MAEASTSSTPTAAPELVSLSEIDDPVKKAQARRLNALVHRSGFYANFIAEQLQRSAKKDKERERKHVKREENKRARDDERKAANVRLERSHRSTATGAAQQHEDDDEKGTTVAGKKRKSVGKGKQVGEPDTKRVKQDDDDGADEDVESDNELALGAQRDVQQPALITGATLRDFQLEGLRWLVALDDNGLSGILADEMGLGKTLQTIAFIAYLRERKVFKPIMVVAPLSTLPNWIQEFATFAPGIPVLKYHGPKDQRHVMMADWRRAGMSSEGKRQEQQPVLITTYETVMRDSHAFADVTFKYIVVDEAQRIKNKNSKLMRDLKSFRAEGRLLLTGTPLQNSLVELFSLLQFIMPEIFSDSEDFLDLFTDLTASGSDSQKSTALIEQLHSLLQPFMLRRLKRDVVTNLPPKKEYLLSAPLSPLQKELYDAVRKNKIRDFLMRRGFGIDWPEDDAKSAAAASTSAPPPASTSPQSGPALSRQNSLRGSRATSVESGASTADTSSRKSRRKSAQHRKVYTEQTDDDFFERAAAPSYNDAGTSTPPAQSAQELGRAHQRAVAKRHLNSLGLQNMVMQLRKVCNHPFVFVWPKDAHGEDAADMRLEYASGKMMLLNRLLPALFAQGRKVLLFSQFTTTLDLVHEWANRCKHWPVFRIDGTTSVDDRMEQMRMFRDDKSADAVRLFLLSTRAGGVGINLNAADTVIFFDSDFNPQVDLQAMDRAHRIGQTQPVLVFRLVSANTVEERILQRASEKRRLEKLVIGKGKFKFTDKDVKQLMGTNGRSRDDATRELIEKREIEELLGDVEERVVLAEEGDEILSDAQLEVLLDRSDEAMSSKEGSSRQGGKSKLAFTVRDTAVNEDEGRDLLADILAVDEQHTASSDNEQ